MERAKMPTAKDEDTRKRNSLMFFMRDWQSLATFEQQEASMAQVRCIQYRQVRRTQYRAVFVYNFDRNTYFLF